MLEDIGNLDFDSNTLVLKITGGKFNQNIKTSDLTLSEEIAQYVKVSEVKVNKDGTEVSVILERTNTNYDDLVGTINVKPSGYSEGAEKLHSESTHNGEDTPANETGRQDEMPQEDAGDNNTTSRKVKVSDIASAKDYLADTFGISRTSMRSTKAIMEQAAANGIEFEGLE